MWILIAIGIIILIVCYVKIRKIPKVGTLTMVNGGVKTGKTALTVHLALRKIKARVFAWRIKYGLIWLFKHLRFKKFKEAAYPEKPLLYSNIPIGGYPYVPLTKELIERTQRYNFGSVVLMDEASLIADSMCYDDKYLNERLQLYVKLIGHQLHGGLLFIDSQAIADMHFAFKRCLTNYIYIHHDLKWIPFFVLLWVREERFSEDGATVNAYTEDVENSLKLIIMPKSVWKKYDRYAFSYLTDKLPKNDKTVYIPKGDSLKASKITSFRKFKTIDNDEVKKYENRKKA